jgi:enhancing lycopene biosynthesis protein 2
MNKLKKIAVVLSGCGHLDGAEIREAVLTLLALDQNKVAYEIFAPNTPQFHTVNHTTGQEDAKSRNVLEEAARIARGKIHDLANLNMLEFDALVMPGGYGVAKNLCTFAFKGSQGEVSLTMKKVITDFFQAKKPIGAICIAPALVALVLGEHQIEVTIGNDNETATELVKTGAKHFNKNVDEIHIDHKNKIITTPAYMYDNAPLDQIFLGIKACVDQVVSLA